MNFFSRISDMLENFFFFFLSSIIDGAHAPRHAILTVYSIQKL